MDADGELVKPLGLNNDPAHVFEMIKEEDQDILKVSGEYYGAVITKTEYENYRFKIKIKWGDKKWPPRENLLLDAGLIYHSVGEPGVDYWRSWMLGQEFQCMEGHFGDYWNIANSTIDVRALVSEGTMNPIANQNKSLFSIGTGTENTGFCLRSEDFESPHGEWTEVELITMNGKSLHIVNGEVVMVLGNSRYFENDEFVSLTKGKIQLQSEACEVFYKDAAILPITEWPAEYAAIF